MNKNVNTGSTEITRKLSVWRIFLLAFILAGLLYFFRTSLFKWKDSRQATNIEPWFAAYVDVTSTPTYAFEQLGSTTAPNAVLSFIVSSKTDPCVPTWGTAYTLDEARVSLDLDRRIARLRQQGGQISVSFGGALNDELSLKCTDPESLRDAYRTVIERYELDTIDLDLENEGLNNTEASIRRAEVIAALQTERRAKGKNLAVWLTLPVAPSGLTEPATDNIAQMLSKGVDITGINVMTMDYGASKDPLENMHDASKKALIETHRQLGILYRQAGKNLNSKTLWRKIGATPMIGQNDVKDEVFTTEDALTLNNYALEQGIGRMSMWSANRDTPCGENYVDVKVVSDSCSGVKAEKLTYNKILSAGFAGNLSLNAAVVTTDDPETKPIVNDDPETSPYQIWTEEGAYLAGVKVVWHGNVYEAKWWTRGDEPDNPVLQSWETPWRLIGPVLPGEKPIKQPTLPLGTYPNWIGTVEYQTGDRVLFEGVPFEAKWWNLGQSPAASASNSDSSPWTPLSQEEVLKILEKGYEESE